MKKRLILILLVFFLSGCQKQSVQPLVPLPDKTPPVESQALMDLINFFVYLNHGKYDEAVAVYGGSYEILQGWNPDLSSEDKAGLLKRGCEQNGLVCLQLYSAELSERPSQTELNYTVTFRNPDNSQFVQGPCCGATEEEMPSFSEFTIHVHCPIGSTCQVLDLPPYVP